MRCLACGVEMQLVEVARDHTMMVRGYEHHSLQCSGCGEIERRLVFSRGGTPELLRPQSVPVPPPLTAAAPGAPEAPLIDKAPWLACSAEPEAGAAVSPAPAPASAEPAGAAAGAPSPASEAELDEGELLLRRAIEMIREAHRRSPPAAATEAGPDESVNGSPPKPSGGRRVVQIERDPHQGAYIATDSVSGLSVLRHQDSARLRAMCRRIGWQVVEPGSAGLPA